MSIQSENDQDVLGIKVAPELPAPPAPVEEASPGGAAVAGRGAAAERQPSFVSIGLENRRASGVAMHIGRRRHGRRRTRATPGSESRQRKATPGARTAFFNMPLRSPLLFWFWLPPPPLGGGVDIRSPSNRRGNRPDQTAPPLGARAAFGFTITI